MRPHDYRRQSHQEEFELMHGQAGREAGLLQEAVNLPDGHNNVSITITRRVIEAV